jgi:hypothetical protein
MPRARLRRGPDEGRLEQAEAAAPPRYWVVGASWGGREDQYEQFIRGGYWLLGWSDDEQPSQAARRDRIRPGDRIAIKKRTRDKTKIEIRALGVVRRIDPEDRRVHVRWVKTGLHHQVPSKGCYDSIREFGPSDPWTREVFGLDDPDGVSDGGGIPDVDGDDHLDLEGGRSWRLHLMIERDRGNVDRKKRQVKRDTGSLDCEACGFNFAEFYGDLGDDFCEVHHKVPVSQLDSPVCPDFDDLAIVCSNCHRMIHKTHPMMSIPEFRELLRELGRLP